MLRKYVEWMFNPLCQCKQSLLLYLTYGRWVAVIRMFGQWQDYWYDQSKPGYSVNIYFADNIRSEICSLTNARLSLLVRFDSLTTGLASTYPTVSVYGNAADADHEVVPVYLRSFPILLLLDLAIHTENYYLCFIKVLWYKMLLSLYAPCKLLLYPTLMFPQKRNGMQAANSYDRESVRMKDTDPLLITIMMKDCSVYLCA
jgi:hypothetical protein